MTTKAQAQVDVIDRRTTTVIAWLGLGAVLLMLTLAARDTAVRTSQSTPPVEIDVAGGVVATADDGFAILPPVIIAVEAAPVVAPAQIVESSNATNGLLGMDSHAVRAQLGAPDFVRRDGSSQMWRYGRGACTLTIFLHGQNKELAVQHVEGRGLRSPNDPSADCAERLVGERRRADLPS